MEIIAHIHSDFPAKFGIPRQSGLVKELRSTIVFTPGYRYPEALRGLEGFSHLWLIWQFSANSDSGWSPTVRPPRLGGNKRLGVFATRSPFRPNPLGLSCVELDSIVYHSSEGPLIHVLGGDMMDGTPIYDIKPYLPHIDSIPEAKGGFAQPVAAYRLRVIIPSPWIEQLPEDILPALYSLLEQDPRPAYQNDPQRIYGFTFAGWEINFTVQDTILTVCQVKKL